ncbi:MAG: hypothetical protein LBS97_05765, partial [Treponema sp.]|nr:hypothetical protein [Treponema sp.]
MELPIVLAKDTTTNWKKSTAALYDGELAIETANEEGRTPPREYLLRGDGQPVGPDAARLRVTKENIAGLPEEIQVIYNQISAGDAQLQAAINAEGNRAAAAEQAEAAARQQGDAGTLEGAKGYTDEQAAGEAQARAQGDAGTLEGAEGYTDEQVSGEAAAREQGDAGTLANAEGYTDEQVAGEAAAREQGDADTLTSAEAYTDEQVAEEAQVRSLGDANTLASAEAYTDEQVAEEAQTARSAEEALDEAKLDRRREYPDGSYDEWFHEADGGGFKSYDGAANLISAESASRGGAGNAVLREEYVKDQTTGLGARRIIGKLGDGILRLFYTKNRGSAAYTGNDEIATIADIQSSIVGETGLSRGNADYAFTVQARYKVSTVTIQNGGAGYAAGDVLYGDALSSEVDFARVLVSAVGADGAITAADQDRQGRYNAESESMPFSGGTGSGAVFDTAMEAITGATTLSDLSGMVIHDYAYVEFDELHDGEKWLYDYTGAAWIAGSQINESPQAPDNRTLENTGGIWQEKDGGTTDQKIGARTVEDQEGSTDLVSIGAKSITAWFQVIRNNLKGIFAALNGKAPASHASADTTYGAGTDANYGHVKLNSTTTPVMDGTAGAGSSGKAADALHSHPTDTGRAANSQTVTPGTTEDTTKITDVTTDTVNGWVLAIIRKINGIITNLGTKAPLDSPVFTGTPTIPTPSAASNDTTAANTAWVKSQKYTSNPAMNGSATPGSSGYFADGGHVHPTDTT